MDICSVSGIYYIIYEHVQYYMIQALHYILNSKIDIILQQQKIIFLYLQKEIQ